MLDYEVTVNKLGEQEYMLHDWKIMWRDRRLNGLLSDDAFKVVCKDAVQVVVQLDGAVEGECFE